MTKKELLEKKLSELRTMAKKLGLSLPRTAKKEEIAAAISKAMRLKALRKKQAEKKRQSGLKVKKAPAPPQISELVPVSVEEEIPVSIPETLRPAPLLTKNLLGLVPINHHRFYLYWEISSDTMAMAHGKLVIRIYDLSGGRDISLAPYFELYAQQEAGGLHIDMGRSGDFCAEMGILEKGRFTAFLRSNIIRLPGIPSLKELPEAVRITFPSGIVHPTSP